MLIVKWCLLNFGGEKRTNLGAAALDPSWPDFKTPSDFVTADNVHVSAWAWNSLKYYVNTLASPAMRHWGT